MTAPAPTLSVTKSVTVPLSQADAFQLFTQGFSSWWPKAHHIGAEEMADAIIEPKVGGRWFERGSGGTEVEWGRVLTWDPPRGVTLSWHLDGTWSYQADPAKASEVEVTFVAETGGMTRVELRHHHLERHGETAEALRTGISGPEGWSGLLALYAARASA